MAGQDFINELQALGLDPRIERAENIDYAVFDYEVPVGRILGQKLRLALQVQGDWPATPPPGPHVSPQLLDVRSGGTHPNGGVHRSPLGGDWQYWSRPHPDWRAARSAKAYMAHIRRLMETL